MNIFNELNIQFFLFISFLRTNFSKNCNQEFGRGTGLFGGAGAVKIRPDSQQDFQNFKMSKNFRNLKLSKKIKSAKLFSEI